MKTLKTITTTGARLVEDVLLLADCQICFDEGLIERNDIETGWPSGYYDRCPCTL